MKLIDKNSKDELAPFRETIDSWLLILLGEDPRLKHQKMQENGEKFTEKWEGYRLWRQCNTWPSIYRQFKEYIEKYIIDNNELPSGVHVIEERIFNIIMLAQVMLILMCQSEYILKTMTIL